MKTLLLPKNLQGKYKRMLRGTSVKQEKQEEKEETQEKTKQEPKEEPFKSLNPSRKPLKYKI